MDEYIYKDDVLDAICEDCDVGIICEGVCPLVARIRAMSAEDVVDRQTYNNALDMANRMADKIKAVMDIVGVRQ